ncbi:MAG: dTMP kinase [Minisyncoccota bacterium]
MTKKGQLVVLYGINGTGKSTQAKLLVQRLVQGGGEAEYIKYPDYKLEPTGPMLNEYLRKGNPESFSAREFQILQALNRTHREPLIQALLMRGVHVVAEDYVGTSIAWGMGATTSKDFLIRLNSHLYHEDVAVFLDGESFDGAEEKNHKHENDRMLIEKVRGIHRDLASELGWTIIPANHSIEEVHNDIWRIIEQKLW